MPTLPNTPKTLVPHALKESLAASLAISPGIRDTILELVSDETVKKLAQQYITVGEEYGYPSEEAKSCKEKLALAIDEKFKNSKFDRDEKGLILETLKYYFMIEAEVPETRPLEIKNYTSAQYQQIENISVGLFKLNARARELAAKLTKQTGAEVGYVWPVNNHLLQLTVCGYQISYFLLGDKEEGFVDKSESIKEAKSFYGSEDFAKKYPQVNQKEVVDFLNTYETEYTSLTAKARSLIDGDAQKQKKSSPQR